MTRNLTFLFVVFLILVGFADATSIELNLTKNQYPTNSSFEGFLVFNTTVNYSTKSSINAIKKNDISNISFSDWLENSNIDFGVNNQYYSTSGNSWTSTQLFVSTGNKLVGFRIPRTVRNIESVNFSVSGKGSIKIDIGNDGKFDWQYNNAVLGYGSEIYPEGFSSSTLWDSESGITGSTKRCQNLNISFNGLYSKHKLKINAFAKRINAGADLNVTISNKECNLNSPGLNPDSFTKVSCVVELDDPLPRIYEICLAAKGGSSSTTYYRAPLYNGFYFITSNLAFYNTTIDGNAEISGHNLKIQAQKSLNQCTEQQCILPVSFVLETDGQLSINKISLRDTDLTEYISMYDLILNDETIFLGHMVKLPLQKFINLTTENEKGQYTLRFELQNISSNEVTYSILDIPRVEISTSPTSAIVNQEIIFSGQSSYSVNGNIRKYLWDFGDGSTESGSLVSHSFSSSKDYTVTLRIEDNLGITNSKSIIVKIKSLESALPEILNSTKSDVAIAHQILSSKEGDYLKVYNLLNYDLLFRTIKANITNLEQKLINLYEQDLDYQSSLNSILTEINYIKRQTPKQIYVSTRKIENLFPDSLDDIPDPESFDKQVHDQEMYRIQVYAYNQNNFKVNAEIFNVTVFYLDGNKSFSIIRKTFETGEIDFLLIEDFRSKKISEIQVLGPDGYKKFDNTNLIEFENPKELIYVSNQEIGDSIAIQNSIFKIKKIACGDKTCNIPMENENNCPEDCKRKKPIEAMIFIAVFTLVTIFYINFYKGPGNFKDIGNSISVKISKKRLFTNKQDLVKLSAYVSKVLRQGFSEKEIRPVLIKKGWTNEQINYAIEKAKSTINKKI